MAAGEIGNDDQERVKVADQRQQARVERGALLLLLWIGRKIEYGKLDLDPFFRAVGALEEVQPLVGNLDLARTRAIAAFGLAGKRGNPGEGVKHGRFADAARADYPGLQKNAPEPATLTYASARRKTPSEERRKRPRRMIG